MSSNTHLAELYRRAQSKFSVDSQDMTLGEWMCRNTHMRGRPFTFDRYPFQKQIADDLHGNMDVIKPSQIGLTECQIRKSLGFITRNQGTTLIFTFPKEQMFKKQSTTRIKPLVDEEAVFNLETRSGDKPTRSMGLYQIGSSFMHVTGATEGDATSISADVVMNDEVDLTDQNMLALFNSRLQNSDHKINQRFSTPTFSNYGIDKGFQGSDQHQYLCRCSACNHWNWPQFSRSHVEIPGLSDDVADFTEIDTAMIDEGLIDLVNAYVKCEKCHAPLDLGNTELREWVPKYPSRTHHRGYQVHPFSTDRLGVDYIITQMLKYSQRGYMRGWYNTVLGQAFTDGNSRLSTSDIEQMFTGQPSVPSADIIAPTWIGIDMGQTCHVIVAQGEDVESLHAIRFEEVPVQRIEAYVEELLATYNVIGGACDRHPYTPTADAIWALSQGRIVPVEYRGQKAINLVKDQLTEQVTHVQANRTLLIDDFVRVVRQKRFRASGYGTQRAIIIEHLRDMVRDENPEEEAKWVKLTGNDHFFHAGAFLLAGVKIKGVQTGLMSDSRWGLGLIGGAVSTSSSSLFGKSRRSGGSIF